MLKDYCMSQQFYSYIHRQKKTGTHSNRYLYLNAHGSGIHNSQKMETTQCPSADEYIGKCDIYHNDILFSHKKKWNSDICYDMDEP